MLKRQAHRVVRGATPSTHFYPCAEDGLEDGPPPVVSSTGGQVQKRFRSPYAVGHVSNMQPGQAAVVLLTVVHPGHARPELLLPEPRQRVRRLFPRVRPIPPGASLAPVAEDD